MEKNTKICPIRIPVGDITEKTLICLESRCEWWIEDHKCCSVKAICIRLGRFVVKE